MKPLGPADIRNANALACIRAFREDGAPLSIAELAHLTELSRPTVDAVLSGLEESGVVMVVEANGASSNGGRPARRFVLNASGSLVAGIDAGPRNARILIADLNGHVVAQASSTFDAAASGEERILALGDTVLEALERTGLPTGRLRAACIAVSGIVGDDGRVENSFAVPQWNGVEVAERIAQRFGCEALLENDIKLAAFAEHHMGAARDVDNILFIQTGNRVSLALTFDGQIFQGAHRSSGEVGSLRGMHWTSTSVKGQLTWRNGDTAEQVFAKALTGEPEALAEVTAFTKEIAPLITTVSLVIDPARIVVGGGLSRAGDLFVDILRAEIHHLTILASKPEVTASPLGSLGTALGALALAFQSWSTPLFGIEGVAVPEITLPGEFEGAA